VACEFVKYPTLADVFVPLLLTPRYELSPSGGGTAVSQTQDSCESQEQAEQFAQNWAGMLDGLKKVEEAA
jgi:hypothetical protein